jgi:hypothetical protein
MQYKNGPLIFTRQLGIGEREHVRSGLLGVGFFSPWGIVQQMQGAMRAADKLGMMLRIHVNMNRYGSVVETEMNNLLHSNTTHQFEPWRNLSQPAFESMCKKLEIVITESTDAPQKYDEIVYDGILKIWEMSGGRFLGGNFAQLTDAELKPLYPQFYYDPAEFWKVW